MSSFVVALGALVWLGYLMVAVRIRISVPNLADLAPKPPLAWPRVSLIVPARNEEAELEAAIRSKLAVDYPDLEVVAIDDRSTDRTAEILDELAAKDPRVKALHVKDLPEGWLGKLNAMARGIEASSGAFILLSDADVHVAPGVLRTLIAWSEQGAVDFVTVVPKVTTPRLFLQAVLQVAMRLICLVFRPWGVANPASTASAGIGAFNLVRRSAYERTPGLAWIKMEVGDDAALGQMLKLSGARCAFLNGRKELSLAFYPSLTAAAVHLEKATGVGGRLPIVFALVSVLGWCAEMGPFVVLAAPSVGAGVRIAAAVVCALALADSALFAAWLGQPPLCALFLPFASTALAVVGLRSAALAAWRGGIVWRGTFYAREQLAAGARFQVWPRRGVKPWIGNIRPGPSENNSG